MGLKRSFQGDDDHGFGVLGSETKRGLTFKRAVIDVMKGISVNEVVARMEPFLRQVVRDEVERVILPLFHPTGRTLPNQAETSERRGFQLLFVNNLPSPIFTGSKIEAEEGGPVKIVLIDTKTRTVVKSGPLSSLKIEIVVLDGDFCSDDQEDWSETEFRAKLVREREGKRPLVTGDLNVTIKEGVGTVGDIVFTDNSSWMRCRKFRLGARVVQRNSGDVRIKEARSEAFIVKDHRGELYKKHYPPLLHDEVWRLEKIAKDGIFHERLAENEVRTVRDFLRLYTTDSTSLRNMLGAPLRTWEAVVAHAATCVVDDEKLYAYYGNTDGVALLFNSIYTLVAASFDGKGFQSLDKLSFHQKLLLENSKKQAYKHVKEFVPIDAHAILGPQRSLMDLQTEQFNSPTSILQHHEFPFAQQDMQFDLDHASTSTSNTCDMADSHQFQLSQNIPINGYNSLLGNSFKMTEFFSPLCNEENSWSPGGSLGQIIPSCNLPAEATSQIPLPTWSPINPIWGSGNSFVFAPSNEPELGIASSFPKFGVHITRNGNPKAFWRKLQAAIIWGSVRRDLAAKRMALPGPFCVNQWLSSSN